MNLNKLNFILRTVPPKLIYLFRDGDTRTILMKKTESTFSCICNIISKFKDNEIIESEKKGRKVILHLTEKGKEIQELFRFIIEL